MSGTNKSVMQRMAESIDKSHKINTDRKTLKEAKDKLTEALRIMRMVRMEADDAVKKEKQKFQDLVKELNDD
ncbi:unnamed protein product [Rhizophagus irregularis]|nr:unnamed protein product [Rhizophagus irregularis]